MIKEVLTVLLGIDSTAEDKDDHDDVAPFCLCLGWIMKPVCGGAHASTAQALRTILDALMFE